MRETTMSSAKRTGGAPDALVQGYDWSAMAACSAEPLRHRHDVTDLSTGARPGLKSLVLPGNRHGGRRNRPED